MEQDSDSSEHLSAERISALLDDPGGDPRAAEHLRGCERCGREQERMRRMRMALSALGGVAPPEDEWERIEPHLPDSGTVGERRERDDVLPLLRSGWAARVAAATLVFAVGLGAGLQLREGGSPASPERSGVYLNAARSLESMVSSGADSGFEPMDDPVAAAEEMARLEALAEAAREALREQPADPALNNFLFRVNERQESLRSRLGAAARLASMDYR